MLVDFSELKGKTITQIIGGHWSDELFFHTSDGSEYKMYHQQDCCESVYLEDINGDLDDLLDTPILEAEESYNYGHDESPTWTFYKLGTIKGFVTLRWFGISNGYYSETADFEKIK